MTYSKGFQIDHQSGSSSYAITAAPPTSGANLIRKLVLQFDGVLPDEPGVRQWWISDGSGNPGTMLTGRMKIESDLIVLDGDPLLRGGVDATQYLRINVGYNLKADGFVVVEVI